MAVEVDGVDAVEAEVIIGVAGGLEVVVGLLGVDPFDSITSSSSCSMNAKTSG